jgi:GMP synthase (glutamine-hydrolysing)
VVFELGVPVLGICFGMYAIAAALGGKVEGGHKREFGYAEVRARGHTRLFDGIQDYATAEGHGMLHVWMSHGDNVTEMPPGFKLMASTDSCPIAGMADEDAPLLRGAVPPRGHAHHPKGKAILERFVLGICQAKPDWVMRDHIAEAVALHPQAGWRRRKSSWACPVGWIRRWPLR